MTTTPPFRDYLPEGTAPATDVTPPPARPAPRPGSGRVWINGGDEHGWWASWQDEDAIADSPTGTQAEAIAAAQRMPAADRVIYSEADGDYIDLDAWLQGHRP